MQANADYNHYIVDVSQLFNHHTTRRAVDQTAELVGGFDKLTDISCHIAMTMMKCNNDALVIDNMVNEVINQHAVDPRSIRMTTNVIVSYAHVLKSNFLNFLHNDSPFNMLNHVQVHDASYNFTSFGTFRANTSSDIKASVYWYL